MTQQAKPCIREEIVILVLEEQLDQVVDHTTPASARQGILRTGELNVRRPSLRMWGLPRNKNRVIQLARSIRDKGILDAITVIRNDRRVEIEDGEARWIAASLLEGDDYWQILDDVRDPEVRRLCGMVPKNSITIPVKFTMLDKITRLRETVMHNRYHDLEMARIIQMLRDAKYTQSQIADLLGGEANGWSQTLVSHIYQVRSLPPKLFGLLAAETIRTTVVVKALRAYGVRAEEFVLGAIADLKDEAATKAEEAEAEARHLSDEVRRLIAAGEDDMVEPAPGKRPIPRVDWTHINASAASARAEEFRKIRDLGPFRITWNDVVKSAAARRAQVPLRLTQAAMQEFVEAVQREAGASTCLETRQRLNQLLVKHGLPRVPGYVGQEQEKSLTAA